MKLNIGCGGNAFPGWVNLDREVASLQVYFDAMKNVDDEGLKTWTPEQQALAPHVKAGLVTVQQHDLRKGFPQYEDNTVDAIYLGQIIEHLNPVYEAPSLLSECMRILKPGAPIRITTPDLDILFQAYVDGTLDQFATEQPEVFKAAVPSMQLSMLMFGSIGPGCTFDNYEGHFCVYEIDSMAALLLNSGFVDVTFDRKCDEFADVLDCGMSHSLAAEGRKPLQ